jgi:hypothetical protein
VNLNIILSVFFWNFFFVSLKKKCGRAGKCGIFIREDRRQALLGAEKAVLIVGAENGCGQDCLKRTEIRSASADRFPERRLCKRTGLCKMSPECSAPL